MRLESGANLCYFPTHTVHVSKVVHIYSLSKQNVLRLSDRLAASAVATELWVMGCMVLTRGSVPMYAMCCITAPDIDLTVHNTLNDAYKMIELNVCYLSHLTQQMIDLILREVLISRNR